MPASAAQLRAVNKYRSRIFEEVRGGGAPPAWVIKARERAAAYSRKKRAERKRGKEASESEL